MLQRPPCYTAYKRNCRYMNRFSSTPPLSRLIAAACCLAAASLGIYHYKSKHMSTAQMDSFISPQPTTAQLMIGASAETDGLTISLDDVVSDSRCPARVNCYWAGMIAAKLRLATDKISQEVYVGNVGGESTVFPAGTTFPSPETPKFDFSALQFEGYSVEFNKADPYPQTANQKIDKEEYILTFTVKR